MRSPSRSVALLVALATLTALAPAAVAEVPFPSDRSGTDAAGTYDYADYLYVADGSCDDGTGSHDSRNLPSNFDCDGDWKYTDHRASSDSPPSDETWDPVVAANPQEFYGVKGTGLNRAWEVSTGRPDTVIAVLDSGIRWEEDRPALLRKHHLNRGELPRPHDASGVERDNPADTVFDGYDVDGDIDADGVADGVPDGVFNVADYWDDDRVDDLNGNGSIDPEDLIRTFSDGVDDDGNGYVDDISGWDFLEDDNNPQDDVDYGHGTGEAEDSGGEADLTDGQCPNCMVMTMRVGDSFVADVNHFADAVVYAVDNGASVVQEALGTLNHTSYGQAALDHAYRNGVIVNASEADEAAGHHNWPAAYDHTMVVNSIRTPTVPTTRPYSYLYFNGCTNFGGYTFVSIPSTACSSEATGRSAGVSGLLYSAARNAIDRGFMTPYIDDAGTRTGFALSAEEAMQLWRLSADDIDFSSPCDPTATTPVSVHPFCDDAPPDVLTPAAPANNYATTMPDTTRYQTVAGWDYFTGYGRNNAARLLHFIGRDTADGAGERVYAPTADHDPYAFGSDGPDLDAQDRIPPEADITWPRWWHQYGYRPDGTLLLPDDPSAPDQVVVHGRVAANRVTAEGGSFDWVLEYAPHVQGLKYPQSQDPSVQPSSSEERSTGPWTTIRSGEDLTGAFEGELGRIAVSDLADALSPVHNPFDPATDPTSPYQPEQHAIRLRLRVIAEPANPDDDVNNEAIFQKQIDVYPAEELLARDDLGVPIDDHEDPGIADMDQRNVDGLGRYAGGAPSPSYHDLDGDGEDELLIASTDGVVHAFTDLATGEELPGWPVTVDPYEGVAAHVTGDGSTPVDNAFTRGEVTTDVYGAVLLGTLAAADLDDDGELEVTIADLEGRVYVWEADGTRRSGFPVSVDRALSEESTCEGRGRAAGGDALCDDYESAVGSTPTGSVHGDAPPKRDRWNARDWGINSAPAIGDLDGDPENGLEIVVGANDAHVYAWHADGTPVSGWPVVLRDPDKVASMDPTTRFWTYTDDSGAAIGTKVLVSPALGDIDEDGDLEVVIGVNEEYVEPPNVSSEQPLPDALSSSGLADPGNTRVYALHHDGADHEHHDGSDSTPHTQDQAYVSGWPVPITLLVTNLLPYVGAGPNTQAVLYDADGTEGLEIAVASAAGPGYVLEHDGGSYLGEGPSGGYRTLATTGGTPTASDQPTFVGVGAMAVGSLDGGTHHTIAAPGAGLARLLDIVVEGDQANAQDHLQLWNGTLPTGNYEPNAPIVVNDLQFFTPPIVGDISGDGLAEVVQSTAVSDTVAVGLGPPYGSEATALRHFTGGWTVASAAIGDGPLGGADDGNLELAGVTREGYLRFWPTGVEGDSEGACTAQSEWPEYGHDPFNSGNYHTDAVRPYPIGDVTASDIDDGEVTLTFTATGDDRRCGSATSYEVRSVPGHVADPEWEDAEAVSTSHDDPPPAGEADELTVTGLSDTAVTLLVRARDDAGNGSAVSAVAVGNLPPVAAIDPASAQVRAGGPIAFDGSGSSDPDDPFSALTLEWSAPEGDASTGSAPTFETTFPDRDTDYTTTVELTVTDPAGASDVASVQIQVTDNLPPVADAGPRTRTIVGEVTTLRGDASDPEGDDVRLDWDFGDGGIGDGSPVSYAYRRSGRYTVELTATDGFGESDTDTTTVQAVEVRRYDGQDRIDTAIQVARDRFGAADEVVLATSAEYADALAGAPFAADRGAPILLNPPGELDARVREVIEDLQARRVHLLGGEVALSSEVEDELEAMGLEVDRFAGTDRFDTARLIAGQLDGGEVYVVEGDDPSDVRGWPDAMIAAPVAAFTGRPILLVTTDVLPSATRRALEELGTDAATIVGGPVAVSQDVANRIAGHGVQVGRVAGDDRFGTSQRMAQRAQELGMDAEETWLARGDNWPDSLTGGAVIGETGGMLLLVHREDLDASPPTRDHLVQEVDELLLVRLLGGHVALTPSLEEDVKGLIRSP